MGSTLTLRLPKSLHKLIKQQAREDGVSINQFLVTAAAEKVSALLTRDYLQKEAELGKREDFLKVMQAVPQVEPEEYDALTDAHTDPGAPKNHLPKTNTRR
jgi:uncharacterized protein (DUF1778 family)